MTKPIETASVTAIFTSAFTATCVLVFCFPTAKLFLAVRSIIARYWISSIWVLLVLVPIAVVVAVIWQVKRRAPSRAAMCLGLLAPALILFLVSAELSSEAASLYTTLFSTDCSASTEKLHLEESWRAGAELLEQCYTETLYMDSSLTMSDLISTFRLPDCTEYPDAFAQYEKAWTYLKEMEEQLYCSGWCGWGMQLWSTGESLDSCSNAAAVYMSGSVASPAEEVALVSFLVLGFSAGVIVFVSSALEKRNIEV